MKTTLCALGTITTLLAASFIPSAHASQIANVSIINRTTGERLPTYRYQGQLWVAGKPGDRYTIELRNRTGQRLLTVVSVDGINIVSGETASANQRGYVLSPGSSAEISGWRKSSQDVASFYFTALPDSYAARTNRPANVGVIGVAAFREYQEPPPVVQEVPVSVFKGAAADSTTRAEAPSGTANQAGERVTASAAAPAPAPSEAKRSVAKLGTGHGERIYAPTYQVDFKRASSTPEEVIAIHYDSYPNLVAMGVIPTPKRPIPNPHAFPADGFVPDPS